MAKRIKVAKVSLDPKLAEAEALLIEKYTDRNIVAGSMLDVGQSKEFPRKRSVLIECACGGTRRVATSDLFQVTSCVDCTAAAKKANRLVARQKKAKK